MKESYLSAVLRGIILRAGYDLPGEPILPPMDLADTEIQKLGVAVGKLAVALGRETDLHLYVTTVPAVRSLSEVRRAVGDLLLVLSGTAVQLGLDPEVLIGEAVAAGSDHARSLLTGGQMVSTERRLETV